MKWSIAVVLVVLLVFPLKSQDYQILHVKGRIEIKGKTLKPGDKIDASEKIKFVDKEAVAAALSPEKGRYIIRLDPSKTSNSDLVYILSATISPVRGGMSTRAGSTSGKLNLANYFGSSPYVWAGERIELEIPADSYSMDAEHYFILRYTYEGKKISRPLDYEGNRLIFKKSEVFMDDDKPILKEKTFDFELFYFDRSKGETVIVTPAYFIHIPLEEVANMVELLKEQKDPYKEAADILSEFYGTCDPEQLKLNLD